MSNFPMILEADIDALHDEMGRQQGLDEKLLSRFANQQPHITGWLLGEDFKLLTEEEQDYLFFIAMCIYEVCSRKIGARAEVSGDDIREVEEANWTILEASTGKSFRERMDVFFESTPQEDLLAFIEDSLTEDDEDSDTIVTKIGREPMFVALKSIVDVLTGN